MPTEELTAHPPSASAASGEERPKALEFLRAALASLRCRERIAEGNYEQAWVELTQLESALEELAMISMPPDQAAEVRLLQLHHATHKAALRR